MVRMTAWTCGCRSPPPGCHLHGQQRLFNAASPEDAISVSSSLREPSWERSGTSSPAIPVVHNSAVNSNTTLTTVFASFMFLIVRFAER